MTWAASSTTEYELVHKVTKEHTFVYGSDCDRAMIKAGLNPDEWVCIFCEYI